MKSFLLSYCGLLRKSLGAFVNWVHDGSGWIPVVLAVIAIIGAYSGLTLLAEANEAANWLLGIATILVFIGILVVGPLIVAHCNSLAKDRQLADKVAEIKKMSEKIDGNHPDFALWIDNLCVMPDQNGVTGIMIVAHVANKGEPSVADCFSLKVSLCDGTIIEPEPHVIPRNLTLGGDSPPVPKHIIVPGFNESQGEPQFEVSGPEQALYEKTAIPIAKGAKIRGLLFFLAQGKKQEEFFGATFELSCSDIYHRTYSTSFTIPKERRYEVMHYPGMS